MNGGFTRRVLGPRPVLLTAVTAFVVVVVAFSMFAIFESQAKTRVATRSQFRATASISAELTGSLLDLSATTQRQQAAETWGDRVVSRAPLVTETANGQTLYSLILDAKGRILATSPQVPRQVRNRPLSAAPHVRVSLTGRVQLSDIQFLPGGDRVVESALPFETRYGRRVHVTAVSAQLLYVFISGYFARTQNEERLGPAYVIDRNNRLMGASKAPNAEAGIRLPDANLLSALRTARNGTYDNGAEQYFATVPIRSTPWKVVMTEPTSRLNPGLSGQRGWVVLTVIALLALAGIGIVLALRKILISGAQLHLANRDLADLNTTLERRVAERTAEAEDRAAELARSNVELEQFASVTSHDLQEPLRKILMFGDRLKEKLGDDLTEEQAEDFDRIQNATRRMQRLINDLLAYSRVTSRGKAFERVNLQRVTREVLDDLEARILELHGKVDVGDLPTIEADQTQMRQLMQNLISNALKFHREGEPPVVKISGEVTNGRESRFPGEVTTPPRATIVVADNGIGFDQKHSEKVFGAFQRLHARSSYDGSGIGLSIARRIAWRHGGEIAASGVPEHGATFTVTLPITHDHDEGEGKVQEGSQR